MIISHHLTFALMRHLKSKILTNNVLYLAFCALLLACQDDHSPEVSVTPTITDNNLLEADPSSTIVLHGTGLHHTVKVALNDQELVIGSKSADQVFIILPATAASGVLSVSFNNSETTIERFLKITDSSFSKKNFDFSTFGKIDFINDQTGVLFANGGIYKTTDSGDNWNKIYESLFISTEDPFSVYDQNHIWVARNDEKDLAITSNGGESWSEVDALPTDFEIQEIHFISLDRVFIAAKNGLTGKGHIFATDNGGNTWTQTHVSQVSLYKAEVYYKSGNTAYLLDSWNNMLLKTMDGGATWSEGPPQLNLSTASAALSFVDANKGWAYNVARIEGSTPGIYKTNNGGESWQILFEPNLPHLDETIVDIHFKNELEGIAITSNGGYMLTVDGGVHWQLYYLKEPLLEYIGFGQGTAYFYNGSLVRKSF